jgi:hypothetical protein
MIDLKALQARFPDYGIQSQPAPGCTCINGVRTQKNGDQSPCLCVCMSPPASGEPDYRNELRKALAAAARNALRELEGGKK